VSAISIFITISISAPAVPKIPVLKPEVEDDDAHRCRRQQESDNLKEGRTRGLGHKVEHAKAHSQNGSVFQECDDEGKGVDSTDGLFILWHSGSFKIYDSSH
jgi:hypothetical protein